MANDFVKFQEYLKRLRSIYLHALCAFRVFDEMEKLRAPNIVGEKEAGENNEVINRFKSFFIISRESLNFYFLMELAKLLDDASQSLHLNKLINYVNSNKKKLNIEEFKKINSDRTYLDDLVDRYEGMTKEDFESINNKLEETKDIREKIKTYRDQNLAHEDLKKENVNLSYGDIEKIFNLLAEILNIFSNKMDFSSTDYSLAVDESRQDTRDVIEFLKRFEKYRIKEIEEEYKQ